MKRLLSCIVMMSVAIVSVHAKAETISSIKAAELACHRIDRLVVLKKIDKGFSTQFQKLQISELATNEPTGEKFVATAFQNSPANGAPLSLTISFDAGGKVLKHQVAEGGVLGPVIVWPGKDPISLTESALHSLIDDQDSSGQLRPFTTAFESLTLIQKNSGPTLAEVVFKSKTTTAKLVIQLDANGKVLGKKVNP